MFDYNRWLILLSVILLSERVSLNDIFDYRVCRFTIKMQMFNFRNVGKVLRVLTASQSSRSSFLTSTTSKTWTTSRTRTTRVTTTTCDSFASTSHSGTIKALRRFRFIFIHFFSYSDNKTFPTEQRCFEDIQLFFIV